MKNYGMQKFKKRDVENFTSNFGIKTRRLINPYLKKILVLAIKEELIIDNYPNLEPNKPYIFVSTHNFVEDTISNLVTIDRNAYILFGTTDQLEVNKATYVAWLNGFIYVDRMDDKNRKDAILKMERIIKSGSSVLIFAEGGFNNTENLLCQKLFSSPYQLAKKTKAQVVPIAPFYEFGSDKIFMNVGNPVDLSIYDSKEEALSILRDNLATLLFESIEKHSTPIKREELGSDPRLDFLEQRKKEYLKTRWTKDVWEEELTRYYDDSDKEYNDIWESMDKINITKNNAYIMGPILARRLENKKYDFKNYMHNNWNR